MVHQEKKGTCEMGKVSGAQPGAEAGPVSKESRAKGYPRHWELALTAVGLLQTICWQCFRAPQSTAVFTSLQSTAEPPEQIFRSWTGLVRAKEESRVKKGSFPACPIHQSAELRTS